MCMDSLKNFCHMGSPVYIYGAGGYGRLLKAFLENCNIDVNAFVVTSKSGQPHQVMGIPLLEINEADINGNFIIGVGKSYEEEIICKLSDTGVKKYYLLSDGLIDDIYRKVKFEMPKRLKKNFGNILLYHRVTGRGSDPWKLKVTPERFEEHIKYIKEHYRVMRFEEDWSDVKEPFVVITFDDGYIDNYEVALPILERYQVPATFFISTGYIDTGKLFWWDCLERIIMNTDIFPSCLEIDNIKLTPCDIKCEDKMGFLYYARNILKDMVPSERERILKKLEESISYVGVEWDIDGNRAITSEELKRMAESPLVTIGAHTVTHSMLSIESEDVQRWEFAESKKYIEQIIKRPVTMLSYPFGSRKDIAEFTPEIAIDCGFEKAAVNWQGTVNSSTNPFLLPRNAQWDCDVEEFAQMLSGTWYMYGDEI